MEQSALSVLMEQGGIARQKQISDTSRTSESFSKTGAGSRLVYGAVHHTLEVVKDYMDRVSRGEIRRYGAFYKPLTNKLVPLHGIVAIAVTRIVDQTAMGRPLGRAAFQVGAAIEREYRVAYFRHTNPQEYLRVKRVAKRQVGEKYENAGAMAQTYGDWKAWDEHTTLAVGMMMFESFIKATGLIEIENRQMGKHYTVAFPIPTEDLVKWVEDYHNSRELLNPTLLPMVTPPFPWNGPTGGGYGDELFQAMTISKLRNPEGLKVLEAATMPSVYGCLNTLQNTPWRVNGEVLVVLKALWEGNHAIEGVLPNSQPLPIPDKPADIATNEEARIAYRREAARMYNINARSKMAKLRVAKTLWVADLLKDDAFYFPYNLDFRGRVYCQGHFLNPQGEDLAKGLLVFGESRKTFNPSHIAAWCIHGANCYGLDKVPFSDRHSWVTSNIDAFLACAEDPYSETFWRSADQPWQFLAWCFEFKRFNQTDRKCLDTCIPCGADATANGIQILSCLIRNRPVAALTNCTNAGISDIYTHILDQVRSVCANSEDPCAKLWLEFGLDRACAKPPVMTIPYGAKKFATFQQISTWVFEKWVKMDTEKREYFRILIMPKAKSFLVNSIWELTQDILREEVKLLDYLSQLFRAGGKQPMWTTPSGWPVLCSYWQRKEKKYHTGLGRIITYHIPIPGGLDLKQACSAGPANYVHSLDASALHQAVNNFVGPVCVNHDCFSARADQIGLLTQAVRTAYSQLFNSDPLASLREQVSSLSPAVELPAHPSYGDFDPLEIVNAPYFLS